MKPEPAWVAVEQVVALNRRVVAVTGEPFGVTIPAKLEAAVSRPIQHFNYGPAETYDDLVLLGAKLCIGVSEAQAFRQGNKRTALAAMTLFLNLNGYDLLNAEPGALADMILATARGDRAERMDEASFAAALDPYVVPLDSVSPRS